MFNKISLVALVLVTFAGSAVAQVDACRDQVARFERLVVPAPDGGRGPAEPDDPTIGKARGVPSTSLEEAAREVRRADGIVTPPRVGAGIDIQRPGNVGATADIEPGTRIGPTFTDQQRNRLAALLRDARKAADRGDGEQCLRSLAQAQALAREAGYGAPPDIGGAPR